ncbi:hypothetical protein L3Q82_011547 [Scortum barcoo]|uniref:Uncharacterized protein n=1 Tax=Scortum barcoo TaxID=214431 RepID=A0ACB8W596_9TELE|nr:hypothetical protein L3Q82_011547 [Scortum barcoo]
MVVFRRPRPHPEPVIIIKGDCVEVVHTYKYLGVQLDDKLDWTANTDALCRKGQSRLYFLRRLASFNICKKLLQIFYQSVVASALLYAVVCWGGSLKKKDAARLDKLSFSDTLLSLSCSTDRLRRSMSMTFLKQVTCESEKPEISFRSYLNHCSFMIHC